MKKHIASICILQTILILQLSGQSFSFHSNSPFGIQTIREDSSKSAQQIMFFDIDGDHDLDLFLTGLDYFDDVDPMGWEHMHWFIEMQENIGDRWNPQFGERVEVFNNFPYPLGYFLPSMGDLNDDQKQDFMINGVVDFIGNRSMVYLRNTGQSSGDSFEEVTGDTVGIIDLVPESLFVPELVDLDGDGDLDLLMSGFDPAFAEEDGPDVPQYYYARNVGTKGEPHFESWHSNPYELVPHPFIEVLTSGDVDHDGDIDLAGVTLGIPDDSINYLYIHLNTPGVNQRPSFGTTLQSPYGLPAGMGEHQLLFPKFVDMDTDGDLDLFVFQADPENRVLAYYENHQCVTVTTQVSVDLCEGDAVEVGDSMYTEEGDYTIHLLGELGCDTIILLSIQFIPPTEVLLFESICEGESFNIGNETFTASGDYTIFIAGSNGCDSIVLLSLTVVETDNTVSAFENTLTANQGGASYQWYDCDSAESIPGATAQTFQATVNGNYAVVVTSNSGCIVFSDCQSVVISGIQDLELSNAITLFPSPADTEVRILNRTSYPITGISVANFTGQVLDVLNGEEKQSIDVSTLVPGLYMMKIEIDGKSVMKRLVVI